MKKLEDGTYNLTNNEAATFALYLNTNLLEKVRESQSKITKLEQDVDEPMKNVVMMLNLLGCVTSWSCCGFNYEGQPFHKDHTYGYIYVVMKADLRSFDIVRRFMEFRHTLSAAWNCKLAKSDDVAIFSLSAYIQRQEQWNSPASPHYGELGATYIACFEEFLWSLKEEFLDKVIMKDRNAEYKERFSNWQYPPKEDWLIKRDDLIFRMSGKYPPKQ